MTLSLSDMASRVQLSGPREAETYILNMVGCSALHSASILAFYCFVELFLSCVTAIIHKKL